MAAASAPFSWRCERSDAVQSQLAVSADLYVMAPHRLLIALLGLCAAQTPTPTPAPCAAQPGFFCSGGTVRACPIGDFCAGGVALNVTCFPKTACAVAG